jgi:anterior pharynx defective protein 1
LIVLITISSIFRAFAPLVPTVASYATLLLAAVFVEEAARFGLWVAQRTLNRALIKHLVQRAPRHRFGAKFTVADHFSISLTHGISHSIIHTLFFSASWLPYAAGGATLYNSRCPSMNYFMVSSLNSLGMASTLVPAMVMFFDFMMMPSAEYESIRRGMLLPFLPATAHLLAACTTLLNFKQGGCLIATPLLLLLGVCCTIFAVQLWWQRTSPLWKQQQQQQEQQQQQQSRRDFEESTVLTDGRSH